MSTRATRRPPALVLPLLLSLLLVLPGCGIFGAPYHEGGDEPSGETADLEKSTVSVAITEGVDAAALHLAVDNEYFKDVGLKIRIDAVDAPEAAARVVSGKSDIALSAYSRLVLAESSKKADAKGGIKLIADAASAGPGNSVVVATERSRVKHVEDMGGARVAVADKTDITVPLTDAAVQTNGGDYRTVKWVQVEPGQTAQWLKDGRVDAAVVVEPFAQEAMKTAGATAIFDVAQGEAADFPTAGWATTGSFAKDNPKTIAAFQDGLQRGIQLARSDRSKVEEVVVDKAGVDADTAKMAMWPTLEFALSENRVQRVADLMLKFGAIRKALDMAPMIVATPPPTG